MPTISVTKSYFELLMGRSSTDEQLEELMANYGMELDSVVNEAERNSSVEVPTLKIDVCANRGDLLCSENISTALKCFNKDMVY